jgi:hypothetical protein
MSTQDNLITFFGPEEMIDTTAYGMNNPALISFLDGLDVKTSVMYRKRIIDYLNFHAQCAAGTTMEQSALLYFCNARNKCDEAGSKLFMASTMRGWYSCLKAFWLYTDRYENLTSLNIERIH